MILGFSNDDLTAGAHILILAGVIAAYLKSKQVENLIDIQKKTIEAMKENQIELQKGFDSCKKALARLEKKGVK